MTPFERIEILFGVQIAEEYDYKIRQHIDTRQLEISEKITMYLYTKVFGGNMTPVFGDFLCCLVLVIKFYLDDNWSFVNKFKEFGVDNYNRHEKYILEHLNYCLPIRNGIEYSLLR